MSKSHYFLPNFEINAILKDELAPCVYRLLKEKKIYEQYKKENFLVTWLNVST